MTDSENHPVFIASTGRSGSKMIARVLDIHPAIRAYHEPEPHLNVESYARWKGSHSAKRIRSKIQRKRMDLIKEEEDRIYIESSHYCSHIITDIHSVFNSLFIHLYRDGRPFVRSGLERDWWYPKSYADVRGRGTFKGFREIAITRRLRRTFLLNIGHVMDDHRLAPPFHFKTRLEKISWLWTEINRSILSQLDALPSSAYTSIALEDFSPSLIRDLLHFVGVDRDSDLIDEMITMGRRRPNRTKSRSIPPFDEWTDEDQTTFWKIAGDMMDRLGYTR